MNMYVSSYLYTYACTVCMHVRAYVRTCVCCACACICMYVFVNYIGV